MITLQELLDLAQQNNIPPADVTIIKDQELSWRAFSLISSINERIRMEIKIEEKPRDLTPEEIHAQFNPDYRNLIF